MKLILLDETSFEIENISELMLLMTQRLEIKMKGNYSIDFLKSVFKNPNITKITIIDDNEKENTIEEYSQTSSIRITYNSEDLKASIISIILTKGKVN